MGGYSLLEINECPGEQFKSALMLTRLITASRGEPIRFVVLRRHSTQHSEDSSVCQLVILGLNCGIIERDIQQWGLFLATPLVRIKELKNVFFSMKSTGTYIFL